jgi:hypothetical protein
MAAGVCALWRNATTDPCDDIATMGVGMIALDLWRRRAEPARQAA